MHPSAVLPSTRLVLLAVLAMVALTTACAGSQRGSNLPDTTPPAEQLDMDPMLVRAEVQNGEVKTLEAKDASQIWKEAKKALKKRRYEDAIASYGLILKHFGDSDYAAPSLYNTAWAYERLKRWEDALEVYQQVTVKAPGTSSATDAMYRKAECLAQLERWSDVLGALDALTNDAKDLELYDKVEISTRRGDALYHLKRLSEAERAYLKAIQLNDRAERDKAIPNHSHFLAAAHFGIAQVYHQLGRDVRLVLPVERMETDLEDKTQLFRQAQSRYLRTIRLGNPYWGTAARYSIAKMYEDFYTDVLAAEIPKDLNKEETDLYFAELRKRIRPLMEQAMRFYEKTIVLSERGNIDNEYTELTQRSLDRLKRYLQDGKLQEAEQKLILQGKAPHQIGKTPEGDADTRSKPQPDASKPSTSAP